MKSLLSFLSVILFFSFFAQAQIKIILDTDPSADPDDVGCMAMLHNMASLGECEILAMVNSTHYKQSSLSIDAINHFYNRGAIPIGDYKGYEEKIEAPYTNYDYHLARAYPRSLKSWKEALDGVALYREVLASAEDKSITVAIIGTMHNFYALLKSGADVYSPMNGKDLVEQKVKEVVTMGGNFIEGKGYDRTNWGGADQLCSYTEWSCLNESRNRMCRYVIDNCPSPFMASGWEVGCGDYYEANYGNVMTGQSLVKLDTNHILRRSYEYHFKTRRETPEISRHSNDQCALHYAVRGEQENYGSRIFWEDDTHFFLTQGLGGNPLPEPDPQDLDNDGGKIHRLLDDGQIPSDNPIFPNATAPTSVWSYGHRDPQGLYYDANADILYSHEHGPLGGDEFNIITKGDNFGWPLFSHGLNYDETSVSNMSEQEAAASTVLPLKYWGTDFRLAPSGLLKLENSNFTDWNGSFLIGSLGSQGLFSYNSLRDESRMLIENLGRVRDIVQLPGGDLLVSIDAGSPNAADEGRILKLSPK